MKFLLDTNFLMIPGQFKVNVFQELQKFGKAELYTLDSVVNELEKLAKGHGSDSGDAKLALMLIKMERVKILQSKEKNADEGIKSFASRGYFIVCTADKELIEELKSKGVRIAYLRQGKYLEMG